MKNYINIKFITKTYLYNLEPLKPHFYIVKRGFTGYTLLYLFLLKNIDCGYLLKPPRLWMLVRAASGRRFKRVPIIYVLSRNMKNIKLFLWKLSVFGGEIFNIFKNSCSCNGNNHESIYNVDHIKPHFYIVKLGFTWIYINFLILAQKHGLWELGWTASFWTEIWKYPNLHLKIFKIFD